MSVETEQDARTIATLRARIAELGDKFEQYACHLIGCAVNKAICSSGRYICDCGLNEFRRGIPQSTLAGASLPKTDDVKEETEALENRVFEAACMELTAQGRNPHHTVRVQDGNASTAAVALWQTIAPRIRAALLAAKTGV